MKDENFRKKQPVIRTPDQRLRVFVSSTLKEMAAEREAARQAITRLRLSPVMFEMGARPHLAQNIYRAYLEQSHVFIGLYGEEYGWVAPEMSISGLEEEYQLARDKYKLLYIKKPAPNRDSRLQNMLRTIRDKDGISYKYFGSSEELLELIQNDLALLLTESFEAALEFPDKSGGMDSFCHLPIPPTPILGREREIKQTLEYILNDDIRLVTLTGTGGSGKTRLSLEIATQLSDQFEQMYFIELAALTDPELVAPSIAQSLGIREVGAKSPEALLIDFLFDKNVLLILDNFEQVLPAAVGIKRLLENCKQLKVLVTSRVPLHLRGEMELLIPTLSVPVKNQDLSTDLWSQFASLKLFFQRAQAVKHDFIIDDHSVSAVAEICRRLDGLPLAIELAAARSRFLNPKDILSRLEKRLPILTGGMLDLPKRQQTMRNTIAWSYDLLTSEAAVLFCRLAVFAGGFNLEAAERIANYDKFVKPDILEPLEELIDHNLLRSQNIRNNRGLRFEMLETIKEYAQEKLTEHGEQSDLEQAHAAYYLELAEEAEPFYRSGEREIWLDKVEAELDNIRVLFQRTLSGQIHPENVARLLGTMGWFCHLRGHLSEGRSWAKMALELPFVSNRSVLRAKVLFPAGGLAWSQSEYRQSIKYLAEAVSIFRECGDVQWQVQSQILLAGGIASVGEYAKAYQLAREAVELSREINDRWGEAYSLYWFGDILILKTRDLPGARRLYEESLNIFQELKDPWGVAETKGHIGVADNLLKQFEAAQINFQDSLEYMKSIDDKWAIARGLSGLAETCYQIGELGPAKNYFKESLSYWNDLGNIPGIKMCLAGIARIAVQEEQFYKAVTFYGSAPGPVRIVGILLVHTDNTEYDKMFSALKSNMGEQEWQQAYQQGKSLTLEQAVEFADNY